MKTFEALLILVVLAAPVIAFADNNSNLLKAAGKGDLEQVKKLLDQGADVNSKSFWGNTPLLLAIKGNHDEVVNTLLDRGSNITGRSGIKAISEAATVGNYNIVDRLIKNGVDANAKPRGRWSALMVASGAGYYSIVELLLENGADPNLGEGHKSPLSLATKYRHRKIVQLLENPPQKETEVAQASGTAGSAGSRPSGSSGSGASGEPRKIDRVFLHVVTIGDTKMVRKLLAKGANPSVNYGDPLRIASSKGYKEIVKLLLNAGVDVDVAGVGVDVRSTALGEASGEGHADIVKLLLKNGADINLPDWLEATPIMVATMMCHLSVVKVLMDNGASLEGAAGRTRNGTDCGKIEELIALAEARQLLNE